MVINGQTEREELPSAAQTRAAVLPTGTKKERLNNVGNGAEESLSYEEPYSVEVSVEGTAALLFHRWDCDGVEAKAKAAKGSKAKKTDDVNSYVYRDSAGILCVPSEYFRQAIVHAAKFAQDPRSPRKSAMDLFKAGLATLDELCSLGVRDWDYLDRRRVVVQRSAITRERPAMRAGWKVRFQLLVLLPEYISSHLLNDRITAAGKLVGVGDFRPTFGRFQINGFKVLE